MATITESATTGRKNIRFTIAEVGANFEYDKQKYKSP